MKALVSRSMKKKFYKVFPDWKDKAHNYVYHVGMILNRKPTYFFWLESNSFTDEQKKFFVENHIRMEIE